MSAPALSWFVNDAGAYVLAISAVPTEHLHRPLIVTVGDDTLIDESDPGADSSWCAWCEKPKLPPTWPMRAMTPTARCNVAGVASHRDNVLVTASDGGCHALDRDTVVEVTTHGRRRRGGE